MRLSPSDIEILCTEVEEAATGGAVQRIRDGREGEVQLELRQPGRTVHVWLSAGAVPRLHLAPGRRESPAEPTAFVGLLRKHLLGTRLQAVVPVAGDRIARLLFSTGDEGAEAWFLVAELFGRRANLLLVDDDGLVRGALRPALAAARGVGIGELWRPPETRGEHVEPSILPVGRASTFVGLAAEAILAAQEINSARNDLLKSVRAAEKRLRRRVENLSADLQRAGDADRLRHFGELLRSAYGQVPRGADEVRVVDWADPAQPEVVVPVDPALSLGDNIQRYFKQGKRLAAARNAIEQRLAEARRDLARVEAVLPLVVESNEPDLEVLRASISDLLPRRPVVARAPRQREAPALAYWQFTSRSGTAIFVGKGDRENDELTFRVARGRDLWMHVDGAAGSHVVVRLESDSADPETLLDAATLAVHYSKLRQEALVDVRYTHRKYLRKPRGAPAGRVSMADARTVTVRMDPERIARLFETKQ